MFFIPSPKLVIFLSDSCYAANSQTVAFSFSAFHFLTISLLHLPCPMLIPAIFHPHQPLTINSYSPSFFPLLFSPFTSSLFAISPTFLRYFLLFVSLFPQSTFISPSAPLSPLIQSPCHLVAPIPVFYFVLLPPFSSKSRLPNGLYTTILQHHLFPISLHSIFSLFTKNYFVKQ